MHLPNTSHFIKLFKKEYQMTPAAYRHRHLADEAPQSGIPATEPAPAAAGGPIGGAAGA